MKRIVFAVTLVTLCLTTIGAIFALAAGNNLEEYEPRGIFDLLRTMANSDAGTSFEFTLEAYEGALADLEYWRKAIKTNEEIIFGENQKLADRIMHFISWIVNVVTQLFNLVGQIIRVVISFIADLIKQIIWAVRTIFELVTLKPKSV